MYDLVIKGGTIVDGSGRDRYEADVAVQDGRIAAVGRVTERGRTELEADGRVVTPGFIDGHTHMDAQVFWDSMGSNSCWHGVTTVVMGNCGFTLAPCRPDEHDLVVRNLERSEDMSPSALAAGVKWSWETFPEYLDAVDSVPKGINYAANIGHSALRTWVMGERAFEEQSSPEELAAMKRQLREALAAGAIGFTTSRSTNQETSDDRPVASRLASWSELCELAEVLGEVPGRVLQMALEPTFRSDDPDVKADAFRRLQSLAIKTGVSVTFGVLPVDQDGRDAMDLLEFIDQTKAAGGRMFGQSHSQGVSNVLSFETLLPFDGLPEWKAVRNLPLEEQLAKLSDPEVRARLVSAVHTGTFGERARGAEPRRVPFQKIKIFDQVLPPHPSVAEVAAARGCDPVELMIDLAVQTRFKQLFQQPLTSDDQEVARRLMEHTSAVMTFSDSGAHVSQISDASIQTYLLAYWVRQRQALSLEKAIWMITGAPATAWGFSDRGLVREGMAADLNIIDPERVGPDLPSVAYDLPSGSKRFVQTASGISSTIVNGQVTLRDGHHTGAFPGRLLRASRGAGPSC